MQAKIRVTVPAVLLFPKYCFTEHPRWDGCHSLCVGRDGGDVIEDIDEDEEECDE